MPTKWLQERQDGSKNDKEMPPRRASRGTRGQEEALGGPCKERDILIDNLLVRVVLIIEMSRLALRHGSLKSLFHVA